MSIFISLNGIIRKKRVNHGYFFCISFVFAMLLISFDGKRQRRQHLAQIHFLPSIHAFQLPNTQSNFRHHYLCRNFQIGRKGDSSTVTCDFAEKSVVAKIWSLSLSSISNEGDEFPVSSSAPSNDRVDCQNVNETVSLLESIDVEKEAVTSKKGTSEGDSERLPSSQNTSNKTLLDISTRFQSSGVLTETVAFSSSNRNADESSTAKQEQPRKNISSSLKSLPLSLKPLSALSKKQKSKVFKAVGIPSYRTMLVFISTTILIWLSEPLLSLVDTTVVGRCAASGKGVLQLAALGPATMLIDNAVYMTYFLCIATTNQIAKGIASKDYALLQSFTSQVLGLGGIMGVMLTAVIFTIGQPLLTWTAGASASKDLIKLALQYCQIRGFVAPLVIIDMVAQSLCLATLDTKTPALAVLVASIVNIVGDLLFVPKFGMQGAAVATAAASISSGIILLRRAKEIMSEWQDLEGKTPGNAQHISKVVDGLPTIIATNKASNSTSSTGTKTKLSTEKVESPPLLTLPSSSRLKELISLAGPIFGCTISKIICYSAMTMRSTSFGVAALAAHNVMLRVFFFFATFGDSVGNAAQTFLPRVLSLQKQRQQQQYEQSFDSTSTSNTTISKQQQQTKELFNPIRHLFRRLLIVAGGVGLWNKIMGQLVLQTKFASRALTSESSILNLLQSSASTWTGWALLLHPFIMVLEGSLLATQDLGFLIKSYSLTMGIHFTFLNYFCRNAFSNVWRTLCLFQLIRVVQFTFRTIQTLLLKSASDNAGTDPQLRIRKEIQEQKSI